MKALSNGFLAAETGSTGFAPGTLSASSTWLCARATLAGASKIAAASTALIPIANVRFTGPSPKRLKEHSAGSARPQCCARYQCARQNSVVRLPMPETASRRVPPDELEAAIAARGGLPSIRPHSGRLIDCSIIEPIANRSARVRQPTCHASADEPARLIGRATRPSVAPLRPRPARFRRRRTASCGRRARGRSRGPSSPRRPPLPEGVSRNPASRW